MAFALPSRKLTTEPELYDLASRALMRRAYSVSEMRGYLARRTDEADLAAAVLARLRRSKYLDDARYAADFARLHATSRRQGRFRIARELRGRGVADAHIHAALSAVFAETDEAALVRARLKRSLAHLRGALDQRKLASMQRSLLRAGFSTEVIRAELQGIAHGDLPDALDPYLAVPDPSPAPDAK